MRIRTALLLILVLAGCGTARADRTVTVHAGSSTPAVAWQAVNVAARQLDAWLTGVHQAQLAAFYDAVSVVPPPTPVRHRLPAASGGGGSNSVEACIIARENGGDYGRSSNPSHFGRYQFSRSTWAANGGDPNTWGSASPAEQDAVFRNTVNAHGYSAWTPYDGCG